MTTAGTGRKPISLEKDDAVQLLIRFQVPALLLLSQLQDRQKWGPTYIFGLRTYP